MDVEFRHITKDFGPLRALTDVSLSARSGTIHGIIGENGAGKSTLMKILTGYQAKSGGTILIDGREVRLANPGQAASLGIGMLYQEPMDYTTFSVLENFALGTPDRNNQKLRLSLLSLAARFGFHLDPDRCVERLTVGERQQIELLRLIHCQARILILDEPTTGISPAQKEVLFPALKQLAANGITILLVSHKLEDVATLCHEVTVLRHGRTTYHTTAPFYFPELLSAMFGSVPEQTGRGPERKTGTPVLVLEDAEAAGERLGLKQCNTIVTEGEVVGLAGLDGAGQSTFLRLAAGLTIPLRGKVKLFGENLLSNSNAGRQAQRLKTSFLPADRLEEALFAQLSLIDHFSLRRNGDPFWFSPENARRLTQKAIATFSIKGQAEDTAGDLSGGNQQRLLLALLDPQSRLILLENPTRGLDIRSGQWVWNYLRNTLSPEAAIIFSSPELDEILQYSDRILVFHDGDIVLDSAVIDTSYDTVAAAMMGMTEQ